MHIYTLLVVCVGFVIFRADTLAGGIHIISGMFGALPVTAASNAFLMGFLNPWFITILAAAVLGAGIIQKIRIPEPENFRGVSFVVSALLLVFCVMQLAGSTYHPFIYFRF